MSVQLNDAVNSKYANYDAMGKKSEKKDRSKLEQAVKDYFDEMLTGLTDEERAEIDRLCQKYLEENSLNTKEDLLKYVSFVQALLARFGYKGDVEAASEAYMSQAQGGETNGTAAVATSGGGAGQRLAARQSEPEIIRENDGATYLLIKAANGFVSKIKISDANVQETDSEAGPSNINHIINAYEASLAVADGE